MTHAAVGFTIGAWLQDAPPVPARRLCLAAAACAALPDVDFFGWPFAHRGITHSLVFALVVAMLLTAVFLHGEQWAQRRTRIAPVLALALMSHSCLDALSTYSVGVAFFAPFSQQRYRFLWTPLGDPNGQLAGQLVQEALVVLLPALLLGWLGTRVRSRSR